MHSIATGKERYPRTVTMGRSRGKLKVSEPLLRHTKNKITSTLDVKPHNAPPLPNSTCIMLQPSILNSLGNMVCAYIRCALQIGKSARYFYDAVIGPGRKAKSFNGLMQ